jgi:ribosomal protein S18 acetylase RimI-like enzyme
MIQQVGSQQYSIVANILTSAFYEDPVYRWFMRQDSEKENAYKSLFKTVLEDFFPKSIVYLNSEHKSASIWTDSKDLPEASEMTEAMQAKFLENVKYWCTEERVDRFTYLSGLQDDAHPSEPHHYLWVVGVRSDAKGKGLGTKMLGHHLAILDDLQIPAYLENSNEANIRFYERLGFKQINTIDIEKGGPYLWGMWRDPQ